MQPDSVVAMPTACQYKAIRFYKSFVVYALQIACISFILDEAVRIGNAVCTTGREHNRFGVSVNQSADVHASGKK
jgi:hypothetical protein